MSSLHAGFASTLIESKVIQGFITLEEDRGTKDGESPECGGKSSLLKSTNLFKNSSNPLGIQFPDARQSFQV